MSSPEPRSLESLRGDLAALRIDRAKPAPPRRSPRLLGALLALGVVGAGAAALALNPGALQGFGLGQAPVVRVAYAVRSAPSAGSELRPRTALTGSGYIVTQSQYISLGVRVSGRITEYLVDEGERVKQGQPLAVLDGRPFEAEIRRLNAERAIASANIDLYRKDLQRLLRLHTSEVSSEAQVDQKENQLRVAQAQQARADAELMRQKLDLEDTVLRAPVDAVVLEKLKEVGEIATPGGFAGSGELIRLANLAEMRAEVDVNEADLARVALDQPAEVIPDADTSRRYSARVVELTPQVNRQKGTLKVEVRIEQPDAWLRPDMSARVDFLESPAAASEAAPAGAEPAAQVMAPAAAIRRDAQGGFAWVVSDGLLRRQPVEIGGTAGDQVLIRSGLLGGEALVVSDAAAFAAGQRVRVEP
jgi:HlyD family secretion protein